MSSRVLATCALCYTLLQQTTSAGVTPLRPLVDGGYPHGRPIPTAADVATQKQLGEHYNRWSQRAIAQSYREAYPDDTDVAAYLADAAAYLHGGDDPTRQQLNSRAEQLHRRNVPDPIFYLMDGVLQKDTPRSERSLELAYRGFEHSRYSRFLRFIAAANLAKSLSDRKAAPSDVTAADQRALDALKEGLSDGSFHGDEMTALRWRLGSPSTVALLKRRPAEASRIFEEATSIPEWVREYALGSVYLFSAWAARTDGWSYEVPEEGWDGWERNLAEARKHFSSAWELNPEDPAAAACMIEVAMGDGGSKQEMRAWFDRSVAACIDFYDAYRALIWALRPRWHGSHEEMLELGEECLRTERYDTCVPNYYFKVVSDIASELPDPTAIYRRPDVYNKLKETLARYFATPDMPLVPRYGHTMAAVLEYRAGNIAGARNHMAAIHFEPEPGVGRGLAEDIPVMMKLIGAP